MAIIRNQRITKIQARDSDKQVAVILEIAIPSPIFSSFDYLAQNNSSLELLNTGIRILVPFGRGNRKVIGFLVKTKKNSDFALNKLKQIEEILDTTPLIPKEHFKLLTWASYYYKFPLGLVLEASTPTWLRKNNTTINLLKDDVSQSKKNSSNKNVYDNEITALSTHQKTALESINNKLNSFSVCCLYGITGSGKTEVYMQVIEQVLIQGKQALVLIPEIGLSPQTLNRFKDRFSQPIAVIHSQISEKQKAKAWIAAKEGLAKIIIGTRSASLAPLKNPGIFIIDEEHDNSFKQQENFRYFAKDFLIKRAKELNIPIILGSATPTLETLANVASKKYDFITLPNRVNAGIMPTIKVLDTRHKNLTAGLSAQLIESIKRHLQARGQVILFLNRRGFAPALNCLGCGWIAECKNCDANLIVHYNKNSLVCHHCNIKQDIPKSCIKCGEEKLVPVGVGTERVYQALEKYFPNNNILRLDKDSIKTKTAMNDFIHDIQTKKVDIIIGTQMITKGHHFDNISLVGILDIDSAFYSTDFRAIEKIGQLIIQVAGRAGRAGKKSEVILQTAQVENPSLQLLLKNDYIEFTKMLLQERKVASLPPYSCQALFRADARSIQDAMGFLAWIKFRLKIPNILVLGPVPSPLVKKKNTYRAQLLLQSDSRSKLHTHIDSIIAIIASQNSKEFNRIKWSVDVDPQDLY